MRHLLRITVALTGLLFIILSCARQTVPSGGPRDTIPPHLALSVPENKQLNFHSRTIELTFDEFVQLNDPTRQIIITPRVGKNLKAIARRNKVTLEVDADWADSTTYTINFREAVQDVTERNKARNLKLAFSTGYYIDSLSISGNVFDILKGTPVKEITVGAVKPNDTFNIIKHMPLWFTETDKNGNFLIENLKPGPYFLYAFDDNNKNLIVDSNSEMYGFETQPIALDSNVSHLVIPILRVSSTPLKVIQARPYGKYNVIRLSTNIRNYILTSPETSVISSFGDDPSQIQAYPNPMVGDSIQVNFHATDSLNESIDTMLYVKLDTAVHFSERFRTKLGATTFIPQLNLLQSSVQFNKPLCSVNTDSLYFAIDSTHRFPLAPSDILIDTANNILAVSKKIPPDTTSLIMTSPSDSLNPASKDEPRKVRFVVADAALISMANDSSQNRFAGVDILQSEKTGIIIAEVKSDDDFILQLVDKTFNVVQERKNSSQVRFENLAPGSYQLRLLVDLNHDGYWNPGNYRKLEPPEPVIYYKNARQQTEISLKANWEIGPLLITYE